MKLGTNDIGSVYLGTNAVQKVYLGTNEVWSAFSGGLLDTYSGATAAYSLRRLSSSYTGSSIKVRRASDNTEQDIGFSGEDLDIATLESFCSGTDGFVKTWYDQSGNGNNATQTTAVNQPQIVSSGSVILDNGKPALGFDGTDFVDLTSIVTTSTYSSFALIRKNSSGSIIIPIGLSNGQSVGAWSDGKLYENNGTSFVGVSYTNDANQNLFSVIKNGNTLSDFSANQNGSALGSYTGSAFTSISIDRLGGRIGTYSNGNIQEIIIYSSDQSSNRSGIETNINDFYSIY